MKKKNVFTQYYYLFVILYLFVPSLILANPSISDVSINGTNVSINGLGFGIYADYNENKDYLCYLWENLEDQEAQGDNKTIILSTQNNRYGSSYNQMFQGGTSNWEYVGFPSGIKSVFFSYWCRLSDNFHSDLAGSGDQYKTHMIFNWSQGHHSYSNIQWGGTVCKQTSGSGLQCAGNYGSYQQYYPDGVWTRHDIWFSVGSGLDACQGEYKFSVDNKVIFDCTNGCLSTDTIGGISMGAYFKGITVGYSQQDDAYISFTKARVEIGNNAIWQNCNHREIQIPTAWSNSSITFTVNQGSFPNCDTAYIFVVDADGVPSAGYPFRIGTGCGEKPSKVLGVEIISGP